MDCVGAVSSVSSSSSSSTITGPEEGAGGSNDLLEDNTVASYSALKEAGGKVFGGHRKESLFCLKGEISLLSSDGALLGSTRVGGARVGWVVLGCGGEVTEDLGKVENFTGAKTLDLGPDPLVRDLYKAGQEGELATALGGAGLVQRLTASPLNIADGSMMPASAWAWAGSNIRLSLSDILLSDFTSCSDLLELSVLFTTVELELVVVVELCCCSICCFFFIS